MQGQDWASQLCTEKILRLDIYWQKKFRFLIHLQIFLHEKLFAVSEKRVNMSTLLTFLVEQPKQILDQLYSNNWTCQSIFRFLDCLIFLGFYLFIFPFFFSSSKNTSTTCKTIYFEIIIFGYTTKNIKS